LCDIIFQILDANQDLQSMYKLFEEEKSKILCGMAASS